MDQKAALSNGHAQVQRMLGNLISRCVWGQMLPPGHCKTELVHGGGLCSSNTMKAMLMWWIACIDV